MHKLSTPWDVENIFKMTGIEVVECENSHGDDISPPYFKVSDNDAKVVSYFEDDIVIAYKEAEGVKNVYVARPYITSSDLRKILNIAGVFMYSENKNVYTYVNSSTIGVFNATENDVVINSKKDGIYEDLISGEQFICEKGKIVLPKKEINAYLLKRKDK